MKPPKSRKAELAANATGGEKSHAEAAEFKMTELGPIPVDWEVKRLGEIFAFKNGYNASANCYGSGMPVASVLDALSNRPLLRQSIDTKVNAPYKDQDSFSLKFGDLIFTRSSETLEDVGRSNVYLDEGNAMFGGFVIRGRPSVLIDSLFVNYMLNTSPCRIRVMSHGAGAQHFNIGQSGLEKVLMPFPPLAEQRRIAGALSDVDELISALGKLIEKKRNIKTGAMQQLLTGKTRLPGFGNSETLSRCASVLKKDTEVEDLDFNTETQRHGGTEYKMTELGPIPKDWEVKRLGEIGESIRGVSFRPEQSSLTLMPNATMLLRANNIQNNQIVCQDVVYVVNECIADSQQLEKGDILICAANGSRNLVGKAAAWRRTEAATFGAFMAVFRCAQSVDSCFVEYLLQSRSYRRQLDDILTGSAINNLRLYCKL